MKDDWSLEGKEIGAIKYANTDGAEIIIKFPNFTGAYPSKDIKILRQKLIEDIDTLDCTEKSKLEKWELIEEVLGIIDKRFGVKNEKID